MPEEQRNFLIAIALSLFVIVAWEMWFSRASVPPPAEQTKSRSSPSDQPSPQVKPLAPNISQAPAAKPRFFQSNAYASSRIELATQRLAGSVRQIGAVFDDLLLSDYRERLGQDSPPVRLLGPDRFDAVFGFRGAGARGTSAMPISSMPKRLGR